MARHHMTQNGPVPFTPEEEAEWDANEASAHIRQKDRHNEEMRRHRESFYRKESDGLFFKSQRGEATIQEWQNKVSEIKARFPYQE